MYQVKVKKERLEIVSTLLDRKMLRHTIFQYIVVGLYLILFTLVYEQFSHGIHSNAMRYAFVIPWGLGALLFCIFFFIPVYPIISKKIWDMAITSVILGLLLHGVFEIYGNTEPLVPIFFYIGSLTGLVAIGSYLYLVIIKRRG